MSYLTDLITRRDFLAQQNEAEIDPRTKAVRASLIAALDRGIADREQQIDRLDSDDIPIIVRMPR